MSSPKLRTLALFTAVALAAMVLAAAPAGAESAQLTIGQGKGSVIAPPGTVVDLGVINVQTPAVCEVTVISGNNVSKHQGTVLNVGPVQFVGVEDAPFEGQTFGPTSATIDGPVEVTAVIGPDGRISLGGDVIILDCEEPPPPSSSTTTTTTTTAGPTPTTTTVPAPTTTAGPTPTTTTVPGSTPTTAAPTTQVAGIQESPTAVPTSAQPTFTG